MAAPALNDENSTLHGPATQLKRLSAAPLQPSKQGSVLKSSRKAFENITNNGKAPGSEASAAKAQPQQRRAFGDISNSAAKPPTGGVTTKKPQGTSSLFAGIGSKKAGSEAAPAPTPAQGSSQAVSVVAANAEANNTAWWEGLEPERPAGKTWEQLEDEREAALEADATRAADEIWKSVTGGGGLFKFLVGWFVPVREAYLCQAWPVAGTYGMCSLAQAQCRLHKGSSTRLRSYCNTLHGITQHSRPWCEDTQLH